MDALVIAIVSGFIYLASILSFSVLLAATFGRDGKTKVTGFLSYYITYGVYVGTAGMILAVVLALT